MGKKAGGRTNGKGRTSFGGQGGSQMPAAERKEALLQAQKEKVETALLSDEKVAAKVRELEERIEANKVETETARMALEEEYKAKETATRERLDKEEQALQDRSKLLEKQRMEQEEKEKELADAEALVKRQCETAVAREVEKIKADERAIREKEKEALYAEWEADKAKREKELERYVKQQRKKAEDELEKAHAARMEAEEKRLERIHEADAALEEKRAELTREYETMTAEFAKEYKIKTAECFEKKREYEEKLEELTQQQAELDADSEYVRELKEKYNQYSEKEVLKLQQKNEHYEAQIEVYTERIRELTEKTVHMESSFLDDDGRSMAVRIKELEERLGEAVRKNDELANMPSKEEIERLRANTQELETVRMALDEEKRKRNEAEAKNSAYALSAHELENARTVSNALESLNHQLQTKLKYISEQYKTAQESKFKVLLDIDKEIANQELYRPKGFRGSLQELCEYVRNYGASKKGLYYSINTIRVFFASLAAEEKASRLLILQGLSGTGKSSLPRLAAEALGLECRLVSVQPSWRDNRELLGYDNDFTNRFKETEFTKFLYEASALPNTNKIYLIVLDEMNLARVEYYFADFLSVLEKPDMAEWIVPLVSGYSEPDEERRPKYLNYSNKAANICVTNNIWFIGTANNDDSTSLITDKVYDRAQIMDMDTRENAFAGNKVSQVFMDAEELRGLFAAAKTPGNRLTPEDEEKIFMVDEYLKEMDITFGSRILEQIKDFVPVYIACGGTKEEAIDYLMTHKILRKLDERYEPYLITKLEELELRLNEIYGEGKFEQSIRKIHRLRERIEG